MAGLDGLVSGQVNIADVYRDTHHTLVAALDRVWHKEPLSPGSRTAELITTNS